MTYIIPNQQTKAIVQTNSSDLSGSIFVTKNINLNDEGYIKLSAPTFAVMTTDNDADFETVDCVFASDPLVFFNSDNVFSGDIDYTPLTDRATDTNAPTPGTQEDGIVFNDTEVISSGTGLRYRSAATTWTTVSASLTAAQPVAMCIFDNLNSLVVGNNNTVKLVNTSWAVSATVLTLAPDYIVTSVDSNGDVIYIGTRHTGNGEAKLFLWNGAGTTFTASYGVGTFEISSVKAYGSSVAVVTSLGQLLRFNGGGFDELASLPVYYSDFEWADANNEYTRINNRGMVVDGDLIYLRLDSRNKSKSEPYDNYFVGGVWCYDPKVGLYHKTSPSYSRITQLTLASANVNTTTSVLTVSAAPITGTPIMYAPVGTPVATGLQEGKVYYCIKLTATTLQLAETKADADAGTFVTISGSGNNSQLLLVYTPNDYGWAYAQNQGGIAVMTSLLFDEYYSGRLVFTADLFAKTSDSTIKSVACCQNRLLPNRGYFITPRLYSSDIEDNYPKIFIKTKPLNVDDEIVVKYKTKDRLNFPLNLTFDNSVDGKWTGTWVDADTFTTTRDLSEVQVGDEIEIVAGVGAGFLAHVSSISESSGTYTVNLDDTFDWVSANDIMYFVVDTWQKLETLTNTTKTNELGYFELPIADKGSFIQFKVELRGVDVTIVELQAPNSKYKTVV